MRVLFLLLAFLLVPIACLGQTTGLSGFDLRLVRPPTDGSGFLNLHGSRPLGQWKFSLGSVTDTSQGLLAVTNPSTGNRVEVVDDYFTNTFVGAIGLTDFLHVGLSLPTTYFEQGRHFETRVPFQTASFGDVGLEMKLTALKDSGFRPGIALVSATTFPSGSTERFTGYSNVTEEVKLVVDKKMGPVTLIANGGYRVVPRTQVADLDVDDLITYGAGFIWALPFGRLDLLAEADGVVVARDPRGRTSPLQWLVGLRQKVLEGLHIDFAGGSSVGSGVGGGDFRIVAGLSFRMTPGEKEKERERKKEGTTVLSESISFQRKHAKIAVKSRPALDRVADLMTSDPKTSAELSGDPELMTAVTYELMDRGISRARIWQNTRETPETGKRTVEIQVLRD